MSDTSIINQALVTLGEATIASIDDENAVVAKALYANTRDSMIAAYNWTFAIKWYELPSSATETGTYANVYPLPPEVERVIFVGESKTKPTEYQVEAGGITTDSQTCYVKAIIKVTDSSLFSSLFTQALAARMAAEMAVALTGSKSFAQSLFQVYDVKLREAVSRDSLQGSALQLKSDWIDRRRSSHILTGTV